MPSLKSMFKKTTYIPLGQPQETEPEVQPVPETEPSVPAGLWVKCPKCSKLLYQEDVRENHYTCPKCDGHFRIKTKTRLRMVADKGTFEEWGMEIADCNPLGFPDYEEKIAAARAKTGLKEAVTIGVCEIDGQKAVVGVCDARFMMSSMGYVVGEKITMAIERATEERLPVILFCCSGGARMQEGIISLMQMAKTSAAIKRHSAAGQLYISVLTDPTTGGVTASFAMLGDIILAEPGALVGFAGPRVIRQTIGQELPEGFQRAEFLKEKGMIDGIVPRSELKTTLSTLIKMHSVTGYTNFTEDMAAQTESTVSNRKRKNQTAWDKVKISRMSDRLTAKEYMAEIFDEFIELHGDRGFRDDGAVIGGIALLDGQPVTVIGQQKGKSTKENITRNFGMVSPEGYRKALRLMQQAEKFGRPIINFVDTPGAACGIEAEERGQGEAIAKNLMEMSGLRVPILSIVIGEGGSGGALGLAVANEVWMLENATYSILSPEGFASILWKDGKRAKEASGIMKITADDLYALGVIEHIVPEEEPATAKTLMPIAAHMKQHMKRFLAAQSAYTPVEIINHRYERFRKF